MSITREAELIGMKKVSEAVAITLKEMRNYAKPGMSTKQLDHFGGQILNRFGARSAPALSYGFPGWTCISLNNEIAHGIPSTNKILKEGDLINIDVSAELNDYWADNGGSFVLGPDIHGLERLVNVSKNILSKAINRIKGGILIAETGRLIEKEAKRSRYKVIKNLTGHGVGRKLHEEPKEIANYYDRYNKKSFKKNQVVAVETFISTRSTFAGTIENGWTLTGNKGGYVAQHEHTIMITESEPLILTEMNGIWS